MSAYTKTRAPTPEEVAAHAGQWLCAYRASDGQRQGVAILRAPSPSVLRGVTHATPLSADGRPVPWPGEPEAKTVALLAWWDDERQDELVERWQMFGSECAEEAARAYAAEVRASGRVDGMTLVVGREVVGEVTDGE